MAGARFLRVRKSGSGLRRLVSVLVLAFALFAAVLSPGKAFAAASITKKDALNTCKSFHADFNKKKHWVKYQKGYKCVGIAWQENFRIECNKAGGGKVSTKEDGKFNCMWPDGFIKEKKGNDPAAGDGEDREDEGDDDRADVEIVVGGVDADKNCVGSTIIWNKKDENGKKLFCDDGEGGGGYEIALIVINILTALVGVLGVFGIVVSGITYLTARDNAAQVAKAKKRIIQIVIGLTIFALLYVLAQWLIPGGIFGG